MTQSPEQRERASIASSLASPDEDVRHLAVEGLAALPSGDSLPLLAEQLGDPSWRVRKAVVEQIVASPHVESATRALVEALADADNPGRRNSAVEALVELGVRVVPAVLEAAQSEDADVRKFAIDTLAGIGDSSVGSGLLNGLRDADPNVRAAAAEALSKVSCAGAGETLLACAIDSNEEMLVRFSALRTLTTLEHPVHSSDLSSVLDDKTLRAAGYALLGRCEGDAGATRVLLKGLQAGGRAEREAAMCGLLRALSHCDALEADDLVRRVRESVAPDASLIEDAVGRLSDAGATTRLSLVQFLGLLDTERVVLPILGCARDDDFAEAAVDTLALLGNTAEHAIDAGWPGLDSVARRDACLVLALTSGETGRERLVTALQDPDTDVRVAAAGAVGRRRIGAALPVMLRRLEELGREAGHDADDERMAVVSAIASVAEPRPGAESDHARVLARLQQWLDDPHETLRLAVALVIRGVGRPTEANLVTRLLKDPSASVRRAAVGALERLDPVAAAEPLRLALIDEAPRVRLAAVIALGALEEDQVLEELAPLARDSDLWVRAAAVRALGMRGSRLGSGERRDRVVETLTAALSDDVLVALGAVEALGAFGSEEAMRVTVLFERPEPELVKEAIVCLEHHAAPGAIDEIIALVDHAEWSVRAEAIRVLGERGLVHALPAILGRVETEKDPFVREIILRALERMGA